MTGCFKVYDTKDFLGCNRSKHIGRNTPRKKYTPWQYDQSVFLSSYVSTVSVLIGTILSSSQGTLAQRMFSLLPLYVLKLRQHSKCSQCYRCKFFSRYVSTVSVFIVNIISSEGMSTFSLLQIKQIL